MTLLGIMLFIMGLACLWFMFDERFVDQMQSVEDTYGAAGLLLVISVAAGVSVTLLGLGGCMMFGGG